MSSCIGASIGKSLKGKGLLREELRRHKAVYIAAGAAMMIWVTMIGVLAVAPLNAGENRAGIFKLLDTVTLYVTDEGETRFGPTRIR